MANYLGLDWGAAKIGVALGHEETRLALAYGVLKNDKQLLENIGALLKKEEIGTIIIGVSIRNAMRSGLGGDKGVMNGGEYGGEKLGEVLRKRFGVRVEYQDEMFTSKMAQRNLIAQGKKHVSIHDDAEAASIFLQSWIDKTSTH